MQAALKTAFSTTIPRSPKNPCHPGVCWKRGMGHQGDNDSPHVLWSLYSSEVFTSLGF